MAQLVLHSRLPGTSREWRDRKTLFSKADGRGQYSTHGETAATLHQVTPASAGTGYGNRVRVIRRQFRPIALPLDARQGQS
jgi:hypothetical protein